MCTGYLRQVQKLGYLPLTDTLKKLNNVAYGTGNGYPTYLVPVHTGYDIVQVVCKDYRYFKGKNKESDEHNILKWDPFYYVKGLCLFSKAVFRIRIRIRSGFNHFSGSGFEIRIQIQLGKMTHKISIFSSFKFSSNWIRIKTA